MRYINSEVYDMNCDLTKDQKKAAEILEKKGQVNIWLITGTFIIAGLLASSNGWRTEEALFYTAAILSIALQKCCNAMIRAINRASVVQTVIESRK